MTALLVNGNLWCGKVWVCETPNSDTDHLRKRFRQVKVDITSAGRAEVEDQAIPAVAGATVLLSRPVYLCAGLGIPRIQVVAGTGSPLAELTVAHKGVIGVASYLHGDRAAVTLGCSVQ